MKKSLKIAALLTCLISTSPLFAQLPNFVPTANLVGYWPFSGNADDASGNMHHGVVTGATLTTGNAADIDNAYNFTNGTDRILVSTIDQSVFSGDFTISLWVNFNSFTIDDAHLMCGENNFVSLSGHGPIYAPNNEKIGFYTMDEFSSTQPLGALTNYNTLPIGLWQHLVINRMGSTLSIRINNNADIEVTDYPGNTLILGTGLNFGNYFLDGYNLDGKLDNIGIWTRSLSIQEMSNLFNETNAGLESTSIHENLRVYPNPNNGSFTVSLNQEAEFELINATGVILKEITLNAGNNQLTENLSSGIYILKNCTQGQMLKLVIE